jgi:NADH-quinone oxidoreductase subunit L
MVTAGVYMLARLNFLFAMTPLLMTWVAVFGALTAIFAATIGFFQYDIKKVLAYSTVSQLGFMFIAAGVGAYWVAVFHLMTHAFFKACLFLGSGSVILGCHHEQDMRKMGGLRKKMPITAITYFISCCAIAGFPLTSGFFSKDEILWKAFNSGNLLLPGGGIIIWAIAALAAVGTSFYMFRSYYMTFTGEYRGHHPPHESPANMTGVLSILAVFALLVGVVGLPHLWHLPNFFEHWLEPIFEGSRGFIQTAGFHHGAEWTLMGTSVVLALGGWLVARWLYLDNKNPLPEKILKSKSTAVRGIYDVIYNKYYVDELYEKTFIKGTLALRLICDAFDRIVIDGIVNITAPITRFISWIHGKTDEKGIDGAVNGTGWLVRSGGLFLRLAQNGSLRSYLYTLMVGALTLIFINFFLT